MIVTIARTFFRLRQLTDGECITIGSSCNSILSASWRIIKDWEGTLAVFVCFIKHLFKKIYSPIVSFSLLFGVISLSFAPMSTQAGFFSSILGDEVYAQTGQVISNLSDKNSQTMTLLQANVSSSFALQDKKGEVSADIAPNIVSDSAILPATGPMGVSDGKEAVDPSSLETSVYVVRKGDSISQIAKMFDISVDTILSANDMQKGEKLKEGDILLILPFSGIEHTVTKGQTLQGIATLYKVDIDEILFNNDIDLDTKLSVGEKLMIPGATLSGTATKTSSSTSGIARSYSSQSSLPGVPGYFINPVPSARKTRGTSSTHKGVDLAASIGTPILAAADGRVTFARNGYNGGFGNLVIISHSNGTKTLYAHQSKLNTSVGRQVKAGEVIGYVGNTGRSRGAHLHFEVHGAKNPGNDWSWKK